MKSLRSTWPFKRSLIGLASVLLMFSSVTAWSTNSRVCSQRQQIIGGLFEVMATSSGSQRWLSRHQPTRSFSLVHAVHARAVDIEDRKSIKDLEGNHDQKSSCEESLETITRDQDLKELTQKILNGIFLAVCFGWAAYTILTIDAGMTRGWTQSEIAMRIPLDNWSNYESSLMEKPIFTKTLINVVIYLLGDWLSQTVFQQKNVLDFDVSRTLKNGFIGLCFGPLVHLYYAFSDQILPVTSLLNRVQKIFMDQTIYLTVKCSIYICAVGLLSGDDWDTCKQTVKDKIGGIVITAWKFWPLVHCITYGVIPARHRILWVNSVDLIWNAILATQAQKEKPEDDGTTEQTDASIDVTAFSNVENEDSLSAVAQPTMEELEKVVEDISFNGKDAESLLPVTEAILTPLLRDVIDTGDEPFLLGEEEGAKLPATSNPQSDDNLAP